MSGRALHIQVIDTDRIRATIIEEGLREAGHLRVTALDDVARLMRRIVDIAPDVIANDLENPNRDVLEHMFEVSRAAKRHVAMFVDRAATPVVLASPAARRHDPGLPPARGRAFYATHRRNAVKPPAGGWPGGERDARQHAAEDAP